MRHMLVMLILDIIMMMIMVTSLLTIPMIVTYTVRGDEGYVAKFVFLISQVQVIGYS